LSRLYSWPSSLKRAILEQIDAENSSEAVNNQTAISIAGLDK
jgi:hypothetical protein